MKVAILALYDMPERERIFIRKQEGTGKKDETDIADSNGRYDCFKIYGTRACATDFSGGNYFLYSDSKGILPD
jgi:hypothetical protein